MADTTQNTATAQTSSTPTSGFCGNEVQVSTDPCNSLYPAASFDGAGNCGIAWHDNRSGNYEIWMRVLSSNLSQSSVAMASSPSYDAQGRASDMSCLTGSGASGFAGFPGCSASSASGSASPSATSSAALATGTAGRLDVNVSSRTAVLTTTGLDLKAAGVSAGAIVTVTNGTNANATFTVSQVAAASVATLVYYDGPVSDSGFSFSISLPSGTVTGSCEARLTCDLSASLFPDVMGESTGRFNVVYQDDDGGAFHLYYVQAYPKAIGPTPKCAGPVSAAGFGSVSAGTPGAVPIGGSGGSSYLPTGKVGQFFSFGDRLLPAPAPSGGGATRRGDHTLYREFYPGNGAWVGISDASDMQAWQVEIRANSGSIIPSPSFVAPAGHPIAREGDFGKAFSFDKIAFLAQSPPDASVQVQTIALPITPSCAPSVAALVARPREQDLVGLPKQPLPPTFIDPVDLSTILTSPLVTLDASSPSRFTIAGDATGTVYTNVLVQNGQGDLTRLIFQPDAAQPELRMVLGQYRCGDGPCAVEAPSSPGASAQLQYRIRLQVWVGPSYVGSPGASAQASASKLFEKDFAFAAGDAMNSFDFAQGELTVPSGVTLFFVPVSLDPGTEFLVRAVGGGSSIWSTTGDGGTFDGFSSPFTLPPYGGLTAPVYYDGLLSKVSPPGPAPVPPAPPGPTPPDGDVAVTIDMLTPVSTDETCVLAAGSTTGLVITLPNVLAQVTFAPASGLLGGGAGCIVLGVTPSGLPDPANVLAQGSLDSNYSFAIPAGTTIDGRVAIGLEVPGGSTTNSGRVACVPTSDASVAAAVAANDVVTFSSPDGATFSLGSVDLVPVSITCFEPSPTGATTTTSSSTTTVDEATANPGTLVASAPVRLTIGRGDDQHPRLGRDQQDNLWMVWHSSRTGNDEVFCARYYADCGTWDSSAFGGDDQQLTTFGSSNGGSAQFPNVAVDAAGEAHVVFQGTAPEDGRYEVYYTHSTGGRTAFVPPIRLTTSPGDAMMPDVAVDPVGGAVVVVWHDNRFGSFEVLSATRSPDGTWSSSGQGGADVRLTQAPFDSLFPRIAADTQGNLRVVWHDYRGGQDNANVYMATYVASAERWDSSAQGGVDLKVSSSPLNALQPDVALDRANGVEVVWHDDRLSLSDPAQHEEVFSIYCPRSDASVACFPPIVTNVESRLDVQFQVVDCVSYQPITFTNVPQVCLRVSAPNATFFRAANEDGVFSEWTQFKPSIDLDTTVIPWTLSCSAGQKQVCVQVQDSQLVGFPICQGVSLITAPPNFSIQFFSDAALTQPLPAFDGIPAATAGFVYVQITSANALIEPPTFDVVSRGLNIAMNQATEAVVAASGASGFSGSAGVGNFVGADVSGASGTMGFNATGSKTFVGRFTVRPQDGLLHLDGFARLIPHGRDICGNKF